MLAEVIASERGVTIPAKPARHLPWSGNGGCLLRLPETSLGPDLLPERKGGTMKREFHVIVERDPEGYYVGSVPALPGCHTQAKSLDELMERVREAITLCLEVKANSDKGLEFVGVQRVSVTR